MSLPAKLILSLCFWGVVGGVTIGLLLHTFAPALYSSWFGTILAGMILVESFLIYIVEKLSRKVSDTRLVHVYMSVMAGKMFLAMILITTYALAVGENTKAFAISFILLYLLFLILESWIFVRLEKYLKENRLNK